jgi:hypothetical protein
MRQRSAETPDVRMGDASSQVDDGDRTPRANQGVRGMLKDLSCDQLYLQPLTFVQILLLSVILPAPVPLVAWVDPIFALTSVPMP